MISICIPTYNFDSSELINAIKTQIEAETALCELLVIDDASTLFLRENEQACQGATFIPLSENIGRAAIRNLFCTHAKYDYLLFLDGDNILISDVFIAKYLDELNKNPAAEVICGGRLYPENAPSKMQYLRWNYGVSKESKSAMERKKNPNNAFMTNNFLIKKTVLESNPFDERLKGYGHEDTLMGIVLAQKQIAIHHFDNPVLNGDIESNADFLKKTADALKNLAFLYSDKNYKKLLATHVHLIRTMRKLKLVVPFIYLLFLLVEKRLYKKLVKGDGPIIQFDFYKLGLFLRFHREHLRKKES